MTNLIPNAPAFVPSLHIDYVVNLAKTLDQRTSYEGAVTEHLRMSGVYWSLCALSILLPFSEVDRRMGVVTRLEDDKPSILEWLFTCFDEKSGGFAGQTRQHGHILYTLSALQILAIADRLDDLGEDKRRRVIEFIKSLQQPDGSFVGDCWGEIDTRFTYCALQSMALLRALDEIDVQKAAEYVYACRNDLDGGFGCVPGAESHAGQVFCCVGALSIAKSLEKIDSDLLGWWLAERQVDSGGLNGRPEKQADVCYSWWILSALSIIGKVSWINKEKLGRFILLCQDDEDGGIADRPADMADVFHTFFGISGLSLLGYLHQDGTTYRSIDPVYALPTDVVQRLGLPGQVMTRRNQPVDERLKHYEIIHLK